MTCAGWVSIFEAQVNLLRPRAHFHLFLEACPAKALLSKVAGESNIIETKNRMRQQ